MERIVEESIGEMGFYLHGIHTIYTMWAFCAYYTSYELNVFVYRYVGGIIE